MKTYLIQIGNINRQNTYKVIATNLKKAKEIAMKRHRIHDRSLTDTKMYVILVH